MKARSALVVDGDGRLAQGIREAVLPDIREAVLAEFADRLATAGVIRRFWIRRQMERKIARRVEDELRKQMPSDYALY